MKMGVNMDGWIGTVDEHNTYTYTDSSTHTLSHTLKIKV
jgi:hypothetical protein